MPLLLRRVVLFALAVAVLGRVGAADPPPPPSVSPALDLSPYAGKVVLLDFWASWCGPCAESFPWMAEMQARHAAAGLVVVAVDLDQDEEAGARFLAAHPTPFQHIADSKGAIAEAMGVEVMPTSILFDRQGRPAFVHAGFHSERAAEYESHLVALLQGQVEGTVSAPAVRQGRPLRPWRRGILAQEDMRLDAAPLDLALDEHIYFSKEASSGGRGFGGGGCGCN